MDRSKKLFYINNVKVLLTVLVVLHHTFIAYSFPDSWYYTQKTTLIGALVPMTMFVSINQSFFMGFFFLLAAYFTSPSYDRKRAGCFIILQGAITSLILNICPGMIPGSE